MGNNSLNNTLKLACTKFLETIPELIDEDLRFLNNINKKKKEDVDLSYLPDYVRKLHNLKSVAGSFQENFIMSASRNILDHSTYLYELGASDLIDVTTSIDILNLLKDYIVNSSSNEVGEVKSKLSGILNEESKIKALVVEKDEQLAKHIRSILKDKNIHYSLVSSGQEAFNILIVEKYDVLITDYHVGKLDGPSLIACNRVSNGINQNIKTLLISISYFDLLPSISIPDHFISKNEDVIKDLNSAISKIVKGDIVDGNEEKLNILCLDDDENIHNLLKISFSSHKISYTSSFNGKDFCKKYKSSKPDLVLLDIILENENGVEVIKSLKESGVGFDVPVVILSSLDGELRAELVSDLPFIIGTLSKPFTPKSMAESVLKLFKQNKKTFRI